MFVIFKGGIEELGIKALDSLTREDLLNYAYKQKIGAYCQVLKYEFKDLFYKIVKLTHSDYSKLKIDKENWCYLFKKSDYKELHFQSKNFILKLKENENGNLNVQYYRINDDLTYKDIDEFKSKVKLNITNLEVT